MYARRMKPDTH